jgi:hypothetical protein
VTMTTTRGRRRVVRRAPRQPALDQAWATVLAPFPTELHGAIRTYAEARRIEYAAWSALTSAKCRHPEVRWHMIDGAIAPLLAA